LLWSFFFFFLLGWGAGGGGVNLQSSWTQKKHETKHPLKFMFHGYRSGFLGQRRKSLRLEVKLIFDIGFVLCMKYLMEERGCRLDSQPSGMKDRKRIIEATTINFATFSSQCHEHDPPFTHRLLSANIRTLAVNGKKNYTLHLPPPSVCYPVRTGASAWGPNLTRRLWDA